MVETRTRDPKPTKEETKNMETTAALTFGRPCLGLDVHKSSITATHLNPGGHATRTWTFPTTRQALLGLTQEVMADVPIVLEASTAGKAVASLLKEGGRELHMAAPNKVALIAKAQVKTDERDSATLAHLYQSGFLPECYVPPPEIDRLRLLVRARQEIGVKVGMVKNQIHALVTRNLLDSEMEGISDWFGVGGLRKLVRLPLPEEERGHLARSLEQLRLLADQEEALQAELAKTATDRKDVQLLMTIPGVDYYTALAIIAEIGDIRRFPTKKHLCSHAGVVPKADNSGERVSQHRPVKKGDMVLKRFLCIGIQGMLRSSQETAITRFYRKKAKAIGAQKAQVAAARKLACAVWAMLTNQTPYHDQDEELTERKETRRAKKARDAPAPVTPEDLLTLADGLNEKTEVLDRLAREVPDAS